MTLIHSVRVRKAEAADAAAVADLLGQLGYPTAVPDALRRIRAFDRPDCALLVGLLDEQPAGLVSVSVIPLMHRDPPVGKITALVVDDRCRGRRVGERLVSAALDFARGSGASMVEVVSSNHRAGAHVFYRRQGFSVPEKTRFVIDLKA
ncbi:MAG: GNAT family N-acetyltransferase [Telmatospirillum sp.]|nr:GNAT family N-acetyltransferase [Telmatospirillum sp.]